MNRNQLMKILSFTHTIMIDMYVVCALQGQLFCCTHSHNNVFFMTTFIHAIGFYLHLLTILSLCSCGKKLLPMNLIYGNYEYDYQHRRTKRLLK